MKKIYIILSHSGTIMSKVVKKKGHYKTEIINDGTYYSVDGTGYGAYGMHYSMSDIARIKFGFKIEKFFVSGTVDPYDLNLFMTKNRELEESIDKVYKIQGRKIISNERINAFIKRAMQMVELNSNKVGFGTKEDIDYRIKIINRFWRLNITSSPLEKMQLFNSFYKVVFSDYEEYESKCYNLYSWLDDKILMYKLFVIDINDSYYYYLDDGSVKQYKVSIDIKKLKEDKIEFFGYYEGASAVSGDYFDYLKLDDKHYAIIKCDVSGKGVPAALIMVEVATLFLHYFKDWSYKKNGYNLTPVVSQINDLIESRGFKGRFAAFTLCIYNSQNGEMHFCNAGDNLIHITANLIRDTSDKANCRF